MRLDEGGQARKRRKLHHAASARPSLGVQVAARPRRPKTTKRRQSSSGWTQLVKSVFEWHAGVAVPPKQACRSAPRTRAPWEADACTRTTPRKLTRLLPHAQLRASFCTYLRSADDVDEELLKSCAYVGSRPRTRCLLVRRLTRASPCVQAQARDEAPGRHWRQRQLRQGSPVSAPLEPPTSLLTRACQRARARVPPQRPPPWQRGP